MLAIDRVFGPFAGLTLFGDHADPSQFYYVPDAPQLARDGDVPELSFIQYRRDLSEEAGLTDVARKNLGGGFLAFTVELVATKEQLDEATKELRKLGTGEPHLAMIPFKSGKASLAMVLDHPPGEGNATTGGGADASGGGTAGSSSFRFFESVLGETTPALYGTERATFSMVMPDHEAAALVEGMLRGGGVSPIGVRYSLAYSGLRPAVHGRITADYARVYHELTSQLTAGVSYYGIGLSADIGWAVQKLREEGAIVVEITEFTDDAALRKSTEDILQWFQEDIAQTFFKTALSPPGQSTSGLVDAILQAAKALGIASAGALLQNSGAMKSIGQSLGISPGTVQALAGGAGGAGAGQAGGASSTFSAKVSFTMRDIKQDELRTRTIDYSVAAAETREAAPQGLFHLFGSDAELAAAIKEVDLTSDFFARLGVRVRSAGDLKSEGIARAVVDLEYPGGRGDGVPATATKSIEIDPDHEDPQGFDAWIDEDRDLAYRYHVQLHFAPDGPWDGNEPVHEGPWTTTRTRELVINPLVYVDLLDLEISPGLLDWREVSQVQVELRIGASVDGGGVDNAAAPLAAPPIASAGAPPVAPLLAHTIALTQAAPKQRWRARFPSATSPEARRVEARMTWFLDGGPPVTGAWRPVDGDVLLVDGPWRSARELRLVPLLPADFLDCSVVVECVEGPNTHRVTATFAPGERAAKTVRVPCLGDAPPPFAVKVTVVRSDGSSFIGESLVVDDPILVVTDHDAPVRRVDVRLLAAGRLADVKIAAVKVQRLALDGDDEEDAVLFTESRRDPTSWIAPVPPDGRFRYRYRIVRYALDGTPSASDPVVAEEPMLLVAARIDSII